MASLSGFFSAEMAGWLPDAAEAGTFRRQISGGGCNGQSAAIKLGGHRSRLTGYGRQSMVYWQLASLLWPPATYAIILNNRGLNGRAESQNSLMMHSLYSVVDDRQSQIIN